MKWVDGPDKTGSNGVGDEDLGVKPGDDESVGRRGALQLEVQELELEHQTESQEHKNGIQEAPPNPEKRTQEASPDPMEETEEKPPDPAEAIREAPSDCKKETR